MTDIHSFLNRPLLLRRGLIAAGLAGTATALAAPFGARAQTLQLPGAAPGAAPAPIAGPGGRSAVIDVNRARTDPIPVAVPEFASSGGATGQLARDIAQVITNNLTNCGLFRPVSPSAFIQAGPVGDAPNFQNWRAIGAQALVTGKVESVGGGQVRVEFRLWDVLPAQQIQGTAYTTGVGN